MTQLFPKNIYFDIVLLLFIALLAILTSPKVTWFCRLIKATDDTKRIVHKVTFVGFFLTSAFYLLSIVMYLLNGK